MTRIEWEKLTRARARAYLKKAQKELPRKGPKVSWSIEVELVSAAAMTKLNAKYRGKAYPTDVLSFPSPVPFRKQGMLGHLVVCLPTLKRQASEQGHSPRRELETLLVHGILHLLGFDHEQGARQAKQMARLETLLLGRPGGLIQRVDPKAKLS